MSIAAWLVLGFAMWFLAAVPLAVGTGKLLAKESRKYWSPARVSPSDADLRAELHVGLGREVSASR